MTRHRHHSSPSPRERTRTPSTPAIASGNSISSESAHSMRGLEATRIFGSLSDCREPLSTLIRALLRRFGLPSASRTADDALNSGGRARSGRGPRTCVDAPRTKLGISRVRLGRLRGTTIATVTRRVVAMHLMPSAVTGKLRPHFATRSAQEKPEAGSVKALIDPAVDAHPSRSPSPSPNCHAVSFNLALLKNVDCLCHAPGTNGRSCTSMTLRER